MDGEILTVDFGAEMLKWQPNIAVEIESGPKGPISSVESFCRVLENDPRIAGTICYNEVAYRRWVRGNIPWEQDPVDRVWTNSDEAWLRRWMWVNYRISAKENLSDAIAIAESMKTINPIREFLEDLEWDGKPRIHSMLTDYLGAEASNYNVEAFRTWLLGGVSRIYKPGTKFDLCLVIQGDQGIGKSTFLARLAIKPEWFNDGLKTMDGDAAQIVRQLSGKWILELGELAAMKRAADVESVKQFLTAQYDVYKVPYDRYEEQRPRTCIFAGTTNSLSFLVDKSGGRRFLPIEAGVLKPTKSMFKKECLEDFIQLWAEVVEIYKSGDFSLDLSDEMKIEAEERRGNFQEEDARVGIIQEWLNNTKEELVCAPLIYNDALLEFGRPSRRESNEIHEIMRRNITGWKVHPNKNGKTRCGKFGTQICYIREDAEIDMPGDGPVELL